MYGSRSYHGQLALFRQSRFQPGCSAHRAFSVYREGLDREALKTAVGILSNAVRPWCSFPRASSPARIPVEQLDGRHGFHRPHRRQTTRRRQACGTGGRPSHHRPLSFRGDLDATLTPVLEKIEARFSCVRRPDAGCANGSTGSAKALLCLKELEYLDRPQTGEVPERLGRLINCLLQPLEREWLKGEGDGDVVAR